VLPALSTVVVGAASATKPYSGGFRPSRGTLRNSSRRPWCRTPEAVGTPQHGQRRCRAWRIRRYSSAGPSCKACRWACSPEGWQSPHGCRGMPALPKEGRPHQLERLASRDAAAGDSYSQLVEGAVGSFSAHLLTSFAEGRDSGKPRPVVQRSPKYEALQNLAQLRRIHLPRTPVKIPSPPCSELDPYRLLLVL